jgi:hypothetical protein
MHKLFLATALLFTLPIHAQADTSEPPTGAKVRLTLTATGVQVYSCKSAPTGNLAWTFMAPQAKLFNKDAKEVGTHSAGPTWSLTNGSIIHGQVISTTPTPNAIPWLLLKPAEPGTGVFKKINYIRRSNTVGGLAPATPCDNEHLNAIAQVPYQATYTFYSAQ